MKTSWIAAVACALTFASATLHAKSACVIRSGYTKAQCDECSNMKWSVSRAFPKGTCVSTAPPQTLKLNTANKATLPPPAPAPGKSACDIHHLNYTQAECDKCSNMKWSINKIFPRGTCVSTAPPQTLTLGKGVPPKQTTGGMPPTTTAASCTPTHWGGATIPLRSPNFSGTGVPVTVCSKGYDMAKSKFQCSPNGNPVPAYNYPKTNVSCNFTTAVGGNPPVMINGTPCCLN